MNSVSFNSSSSNSDQTISIIKQKKDIKRKDGFESLVAKYNSLFEKVTKYIESWKQIDTFIKDCRDSVDNQIFHSRYKERINIIEKCHEDLKKHWTTITQQIICHGESITVCVVSCFD